MAVYTRQSSFSDGDTITAALLNNEYDQLLAAFHVSTGHTHDGSTTGDGGPLSTLYSNAISFGTGADTDIVVTFSANTNSGVLTWMEDEDLFKFTDVINVGVDDAGHDVKFFGDTASRYWLWDTSADGVVQLGTLTVGVDDAGYDVKFFGAASGSYLLWDESADSLLLTDDTPLKIGDSQDLTLYHDGSNSYITNAVGALKVATETSGIAVTIGHTTSETTIADNATITGDLSVGGNFDVTGTLDFSDSNITNIGSIALDTITNDGTDITLDSSGDIILDADGADVFLKDAGTTFGSLTQSGGELLIKSGSTPTTAATFSGANVTLAGTVGSGAITSTGVVIGTTVEPNADTSSGDNAAIGYTATEGLILTGQGSTNDITIKNDADSAVISIPTGTTNVTIAGDLTISGDDLTMGTNTNTAIMVADGTNFNPVVPSGDVGLTNAGVFSIASGVIVNADVNASAAIVDTKLNTISTAGKVDIGALEIDGASEMSAGLADADLFIVDDGGGGTEKSMLASRLPTYLFAKVSGDVTINSSGVGAIAGDVIVNADINSSAAIVDTKLATISTADKVSGAAIQVDGATDGTGITLADADKFLVDDDGTTKYINASQLNAYTSASILLDDVGTGDAAVTLATSTGNITVDAQGDDTDIIFKGTDGTVDTTFLTIDGSEAGAATFNDKIVATELDISGNVDIDGTLEADAITIDGTTLAETIADTVGAMVTSNTESGITVAYDDADNTLDFTVGTLNQNTTGTAAIATTVTITDNESTDESNALIFTSGGDVDGGNLGLESDGTLTYNPSTGKVTATGFVGTLEGNVTGDVTGNTSGTAATVTTAAQTNITSLGTLTALTVDDVSINGKVVTMTGSASDTAVFTAGTNGTLDITTTDAAAAAANIQITADGTVDIDSAGILTLDSGAAINIEPASGSAILLDGTISVDAGVVTGATSITSTAFVGDITGDVTGNTSGTAATVTTAAQSNITSLGTLTTLTVDNVNVNGTTIGHTSDTDLITLADGIATVAGEISVTTLDIGGTNVTATAAELNYCDGVTSNIQTQISALDPTALAIALG